MTSAGQFGPMTRDAIFAFQSIFGLPITGVVGQVTWDRLMLEAANVSNRASTAEPYQGVRVVNNLGVQTRMSPMMLYLLSHKMRR